mmetsp:Transcript_105074/g.338844  ORF Transcript_105074/g.338844 Transcript_105074/m.338844 type:complete len:212 (-) Transcript_105074:657-1292(-)
MQIYFHGPERSSAGKSIRTSMHIELGRSKSRCACSKIYASQATLPFFLVRAHGNNGSKEFRAEPATGRFGGGPQQKMPGFPWYSCRPRVPRGGGASPSVVEAGNCRCKSARTSRAMTSEGRCAHAPRSGMVKSIAGRANWGTEHLQTGQVGLRRSHWLTQVEWKTCRQGNRQNAGASSVSKPPFAQKQIEHVQLSSSAGHADSSDSSSEGS